MIKKYFIAGLALLLPAVLTVMLFLFTVNFLTKPFVGTIERVLDYYHLMEGAPLVSQQIITFLSRLIILILLFLGTVLIGLLTRILFFHYFIRLGDWILHNTPFINKIYKAAKDVIETLFNQQSAPFSQVVLIPFPYSEGLCIGLITNDSETHKPVTTGHGNISVFVPATPNPTIGFMLLYKKEQLVYLDMTADEAIKFVVSCGVMIDKIKIKEPPPTQEKRP